MNSKTFKCECCDQAFRLKKNLRSHVFVAHAEKKDHICDICDKAFAHSYALKSHKKKRHELKIKYLKCTLCEKTFTENSKLKNQIHWMRNVSSEKKMIKTKCNLRTFRLNESS